MDAKANFNVLETIEKIHLHSRDSHLRQPFFELLKEEIKALSEYLQVEELPTVIFANAFTLWFTDNSFNEVFKYFGMNEFLGVLKHRTPIELLFERNLLLNKRSRNRHINTFELPQSIINRISKGEMLPQYSEEVRERGFIEVLEDFEALSEQFDKEEITFREFRAEINTLIQENLQFPFFEKMQTWKLDDFETYFLLDTIWDAINNGDNQFNTDVSSTVNDYYKTKSLALEFISALNNGETRLNILKLIELEKTRFASRTRARLSKNVVKLLKETQNIELEFIDNENTGLIKHNTIKGKSLFYNPKESEQMATLNRILSETKFRSIQRKMSQKSMPTGVTVLLHGEPGTGKTESVFQLAKQCGRNIFKVDISQTKTMWFGESEKLVKKIFTDYADFKKEEKRCPILLFNEADAVIGKRKPAGSSNVAETENAIQNILLEELEKFEGILFATTNLLSNLDQAFERRFLFKVKFEKPGVENAAKIWNSKLPFLSEKESLELAARFEFSGGEMENIARKCTMNELLNCTETDFNDVERFCKEEKWGGEERKRIGF